MARGSIKRMQTPKTKRIVWEARLAVVDRAGKRRHLRRRFPTKAKAENWLSETEAAVIVDGISVSPSMTAGAYAEVWLARMATTWTPGTTRRAEQYWKHQLAPILGEVRLDNIDRARCQATIDALTQAGYAPRTVHTALAQLRSLLNAAVADGLIPRNPAQRLTLPRIDRREPSRWTPAQTRSFLDSIAGTDLHALGMVLVMTGLRIGEVMGLRWRAIDWSRGTLRVAATVAVAPDGGMAIREDVKSPASRRTVPLPPALVEVLRAHRDRQVAWLDQRGLDNPDDRVFLDATGAGLHPATARLHLRKAMEAAGVPVLTPHDLRHQAATQLMEAGVHPLVVSRLLGHAHIAVTLGIYSHPSEALTRDAVDTLAGLLDGDD